MPYAAEFHSIAVGTTERMGSLLPTQQDTVNFEKIALGLSSQ